MNISPCFSLIIPTYSLSQQLIPCLESIVSQDIDSNLYEIIIIDDCSEDNTLSVAKEFLNKFSIHQSFYSTSKNGGPGAARNIGIDHAIGGWLVFIDGDDRITPNFLSLIHQKIKENMSSDLDCIAYNWKYVNPDPSFGFEGRKDITSLLSEPSERLKNYLAMGMDGSVIYTAMRRSLLTSKNIRFFEGLHEDIDMIFKVYFHAARIEYVETAIYQKFNRSDSIVNTLSEDHITGYLRAWRECADYAIDNQLNSDVYKQAFLFGHNKYY